MATINEKGVNYNSMAIPDENLDYGMLGKESILKINEIGRFIECALKDGAAGNINGKEAVSMESCLYKLQAVLYHLRRIRDYKENLLNNLKNQPKNKDISEFTMCLLEKELVFEFEALLLQARACLDTLTILITNKLGEKINYFSGFKQILEKHRIKNPLAENIITLLKEGSWLTDSDILSGESTTRNYAAHRGSLLTTQQCCITISGMKDGKILLFDMEFHKSVPVMNTASKILENVSYFTINALSILCGLSTIEKKEFINYLGREFVVLSEATVETGNGIKIGVIKEMNRVNIIIEDRYISKEALSKAIQLSDSKKT